MQRKRHQARVKQEEVTFMGHKISDRGIEPDARKVEAIRKMPHRKMSMMLDDFAGWFSTSPNF